MHNSYICAKEMAQNTSRLACVSCLQTKMLPGWRSASTTHSTHIRPQDLGLKDVAVLKHEAADSFARCR